MPDLGLSVAVSRSLLGLADLEINDHAAYYCAPQLLGGTVTWTRVQVGSPFLDGQVTTGRIRQNVTEQIGVEVLADDPATLRARLDELIAAFLQHRFTLWVAVSGQLYSYQAEAADYTVSWTGPRFMAHQVQVLFAVPRQPVALVGVA